MRVAMAAAFLVLSTAAIASAEDSNLVPLPKLEFFFGVSADPNGGTADVSADLGGKKLVSESNVVGVVAHISKSAEPTKRIDTKIQFFYGRRLFDFRKCPVFWNSEVGPDALASKSLPDPPGTMSTNWGYAVGSGPSISIALNKARTTFFQPHAEMVKGSMQDLGWRGGFYISFGSN